MKNQKKYTVKQDQVFIKEIILMIETMMLIKILLIKVMIYLKIIISIVI